MGTSAGSGGMSQMLQMIVGLGDLQLRKKQLAQSDQQHKDQMGIALQQLGLSKEDANFTRGQTALKALIDGLDRSNTSIDQLAQILRLNPDQVTALKGQALTAPKSADAFHNQVVQQGYQAMPDPLRARVDQEAATSTLTGGGTGNLAQSGLMAQIAGGTIPQSALAPLQVGYRDQVAKPMQGAVNQQILSSPAMISKMADIQTGGLTDEQAGGLKVQQQNANTQQLSAINEAAYRDLSLKLASKQTLTIPDVMTGMKLMEEQAKTASDAKIYPAARIQALTRYNTTAQLLGMPALKIGEAFDESGWYGAMMKRLGNSQPGVAPSPVGGMPQP